MAIVLVTNPQPHCTCLAALLEAKGCQVIQLPLWRIGAPADGGVALQHACQQLSTYDWAAFTSQFAVDAVMEQLQELGASWPPDRPRVAAVGKGTAEALRIAGVPVDCLSTTSNAVALGEAMAELGVSDKRVLLPQTPEARPSLAHALVQAGAQVSIVEAYAASPVEVDTAQWLAEHCGTSCAAVVFTAPSAVERFVTLFGRPPYTAPFAAAHWYAIGSTTSAAMQHAGITPVTTAPEPRFESLADAVRKNVTN